MCTLITAHIKLTPTISFYRQLRSSFVQFLDQLLGKQILPSTLRSKHRAFPNLHRKTYLINKIVQKKKSHNISSATLMFKQGEATSGLLLVFCRGRVGFWQDLGISETPAESQRTVSEWPATPLCQQHVGCSLQWDLDPRTLSAWDETSDPQLFFLSRSRAESRCYLEGTRRLKGCWRAEPGGCVLHCCLSAGGPWYNPAIQVLFSKSVKVC